MYKIYCYACKANTGDFIKSGLSSNGRQVYICRECNTKKVATYRSTENGRKNIYKAVRRSTQKYPEKQKAREILRDALRAGKVIKPDRCPSCGETRRIQGHHENYSKPLDVIWMCSGCHSTTHRKFKQCNIDIHTVL